MQPTLFDVIQVKREAIKRSSAHADKSWKAEALVCLFEVARTQPTLTADDVRERMEAKEKITDDFPHTHDKRATGPVMMQGHREGWIQPTNRSRQGRFVSSHGRPQKVWLSRVYRGNARVEDEDPDVA